MYVWLLYVSNYFGNVADYLGLPYPPPYIQPFRPKTIKGYNYASAACGILRKTGSEAVR